MKNWLLLLTLLCNMGIAQQKTIYPGDNLIVEGIPVIPASIAEEVKQYSESRTATMCSWHPVRKEMLISTRFGNVPQLHQVRMPMGSRRQLTIFDEPITTAIYQPVKGDYFIFNKDIGGNEFSQLYRYDLASGNVTLLTDGGRSQNSGIVWSNKGDRIAYGSTRRNGTDRDIYLMVPANKASDKLLTQMQGGGWAAVDWSPNDDKLLVLEYVSVNESHLWLIDVATGNKTALTDRTRKGVALGGGLFDKTGKGLNFVTDQDNEFSRLAYMDLASKKVSFITTPIKWNVESYDLSKDGKHLAFIVNNAGSSELYLLNTSNNTYKKVTTLPVGMYTRLTFHHNSTDLALSVNSAQSATDVYVLNTATGKAERWTESEMGGIMREQLRMPSMISWKSFDGQEITGIYYKPAAKFNGKRPVIINIHGGPESQSRPVFQGASNYYLNELGVAIIYSNVRGSTGYGKSFVAADNGNKREESVQDIGALLDWVEKQPELDADRVMVTGGSYGGYMTLAVSTHYPEKIRCAIDVVGISNFNTFLKNTESYRRDLRRAEYGDERDPEMAAFFERTAPLNNIQKIKKPLFIVQGGNDPRVPRTEATQMVEKLKQNGNVVWYLEAKDEGHGFAKKNNADFQRYATIMFMKQYLLK
ncbi:S9 family peptidase [Aridibaculum aurantiacum]|uniref:S9 family peptidase n=1 Tax=Aridibaculum aurantiacum TaxID=2810307 RepID=UPI001A95C922|nr:S9 family peptidase [Aridibaculum aurantiacum]